MPALFANNRLRIEQDTVIHIPRYLPNSKGKIKVALGQEVSPGDILTEGQISGGFRTIHLSQEMNEDPSKASGFLNRPIGQIIYRGELLAAKKELFGMKQKIILSPVDGVVEYYDKTSGNLRIKLLPKISKLVSGVFGIVDFIDQGKNLVVIRSVGTVIHGVIGSGRSREGLLEVLSSPEMLVSSKQLLPSQQGKIVVGGSLIFLEALEKAVSLGIAGIISGGINAHDYLAMSGGRWNFQHRHFTDVGVGLIVTEGFGSIPLPADVFDHLLKYQDRFVIMEGNRSRMVLPSTNQNCMINIRKTKIPFNAEKYGVNTVDVLPLEVGSKVRLLSPRLFGRQGIIESIDQAQTQLESGLETIMVSVVTDKEKVRVPYLNLEIVGPKEGK